MLAALGDGVDDAVEAGVAGLGGVDRGARSASSDEIGARVLLISWAIRRMTFFHLDLLARELAGQALEGVGGVRAAADLHVAHDEVVGLEVAALVVDGEDRVAAAADGLAQLVGQAGQEVGEAGPDQAAVQVA